MSLMSFTTILQFIIAKTNVLHSAFAYNRFQLSIIDGLNLDPDVHGVMVQLPLPHHLREDIVCNAVNADKVSIIGIYILGKKFLDNFFQEQSTKSRKK
jgi:5,10-methylene-tetrahydrofolate dehydrogenase/methenyl tetrahydrofolate cyclohydrolase